MENAKPKALVVDYELLQNDEQILKLVSDLASESDLRIFVLSVQKDLALDDFMNNLTDKNIGFSGVALRAPNDRRAKWRVKEEMWQFLTGIFDIDSVIETDKKTVAKAEELGYRVFN